MSFRRALPAAILFLGLAAGVSFRTPQVSAQSTAPVQHHHIIFALTSGEEADWNLTMGNIRNLLKGVPDAEVEVVSYGPGIMMIAKASPVAADIHSLQELHVKFMACENSMRGRKLTVADLVDGAIPVPSGIVEVVTKEEQGWTYIKAGR